MTKSIGEQTVIPTLVDIDRLEIELTESPDTV